MPPTPWDVRRPPSPDSRRPPARLRPRCRLAAELDQVPEDHPSASWPYCAVGLISSSRESSAEPTRLHRHGRSAGGMSSPSGTDQGTEPAADSTDDPVAEQRPEVSHDPPTEAAPIIDDHPTEII